MSNIHIYDDQASLADGLGKKLEHIIEQLIPHLSSSTTTTADHKYVTIGLSGGSLIQILESALPMLPLQWPKLRFFFC